MARTATDYWRDVRSLPIYQGAKTIDVDWAAHFPGSIPYSPSQPGSAIYVLGYDPMGLGWVDQQAQYGPMPEWANRSLEDRVAILEDKIAGTPDQIKM